MNNNLLSVDKGNITFVEKDTPKESPQVKCDLKKANQDLEPVMGNSSSRTSLL